MVRTRFCAALLVTALLVTALPAKRPAQAAEPGQAPAAEGRPGELIVVQPWSRPTPPAMTVGVVYFSIINTGKVADQLLDITSPVAQQVEIHETRTAGGIVEMRAVGLVACPPGTRVKSEPGGLHVMLMGLTHPLVAGTQFPLSLHFRHAGVVQVQVLVRELQ